MIIPKFSVDQNDEFIIVVARTPYIKASEADFYLIENQFKFYCKPYFLRLTFSHNITENGNEKASYNVNTQDFTFYLPKETVGQKFSDLDLITKLLEKKSNNTTSKIQVLSGEHTGEQQQEDDDEDENGQQEDDEEWEFEQIVEPEPSLDELKNKVKYGFNDGYSDFFQGLESDIGDIIDIPIIDEVSKQERTKVRVEFESIRFDPERYMENHIFNDDVKELLHYKCYWESLIEKKNKLKNDKLQSSDAVVVEQKEEEEKEGEKKEQLKVEVKKVKKEFDPSNLEDYQQDDDDDDDDEQEEIENNGNDEVINETTVESNQISNEILDKINSTLAKKISIVNEDTTTEEEINKKLNGDGDQIKYSKKLITFNDEEKELMKNLPNKEYMISNEKSILLGLVDIIYAYAYNERVNMGYENIESAWNICKLSGTLSNFDSFYNLTSVMECCFKRSITFPLYRSWLLSERVLRDTKQIFQLGKRCLLKCLLDIKKKLESSEFKYYLNRLYIDDYCIWLQHANKKKLKSLRNKLSEFVMLKSMIDWPLEEYEKLVEEEGMVFGEDEEEQQGEDEEIQDEEDDESDD